MADSNPFGALKEDEDTYETFQQGEQKDATFFLVKSLVTDAKLNLPDAQAVQTEDHLSLLECSSKYGYFVAATAKGFCLGKTEKLRKTVYATGKGEAALFEELIQVEVKQGKIHHINLSADQLELFVSVASGTLLTYSVRDIVQQKESASPLQTYSVGCEIINLHPNPEAYPDIIAIQTKKNQCELIQNNGVIATIDDVHSICWSRKGKQIACGSSDGSINTYNLEGKLVVEIKPPAAFQGDEESRRVVESIVWLENKLFFAIYTPTVKDSDQVHSAYIVDSSKTTEDERFVLMDEVLTLLALEHPSAYFYSVVVRNIGPEAKTVIILANSAANELNVVGQDDDGRWATWMLDTTPSLPLNSDETDDTYPVGLTVDYSASEPLPPFDVAESETPVPPMPVLYVMNNEGFLLCFHLYNANLAKSGIKFEDMVEAQDLDTIPSPQKPAITASESKIPTAIPSAFGANSPSPITGSTGFGFISDASPKKFASLAKSTFVETSKLPQPVSTFGSPSTFGQSSGFGQPAFGSTSFGSAAPVMSSPLSFGGFKNVATTAPNPSSTDTYRPFGEPSFAPSRLGLDTEPTSASTPKLPPSSDEQPSSSTKPHTSAFGQNLFGATSFTSTSEPSTAEDENTKNQESVSDAMTAKSSGVVNDDKPLDSVPTSKEKSTSDVSNEQEPTPRTVSEGDQDAGCSMSFEQVKISLEDDDVDVRSGDSDFSKTESNQEDKEVDDNSINSEDDYFDRENQTSSEQESGDEEDQLAAQAKLKLKQEHKAEKERNENEKRLEEVARLKQKRAASEKRLAEEQHLADERRIAKDTHAAEVKRLEDEAERLEQEAKRLEDERIAEIKRMEEERVAEEKRLEAKRVAAIKPDLHFTLVPKNDDYVEPHVRSKGLAPMAAEFEEIYFSTLEEMESTTRFLGHMENELSARNKDIFNPARTDTFDNFKYAWKIADAEAISYIVDDLNMESKSAKLAAQYNQERTIGLLDDTETLKDDKDVIGEYLDANEFDKPLEGVALTNELETKESYLQAKRPDIDALFEKIDSKLAQLKEQSTEQLPTKYSKMKRFELEKIVRDIRRDINTYDDKVYRLSTKELDLRRKIKD